MGSATPMPGPAPRHDGPAREAADAGLARRHRWWGGGAGRGPRRTGTRPRGGADSPARRGREEEEGLTTAIVYGAGLAPALLNVPKGRRRPVMRNHGRPSAARAGTSPAPNTGNSTVTH